MEPIKKIELIESEYWSCCNDEHRHRTQSVAQKCIDKSNAPRKIIKRWSKDELFAFLDRKESGESMVSIAREQGFSVSNVVSLIDKAERIRDREARTGESYVMPHDRGSSHWM